MKQFKHKKTGAEATQIQIGDYKSGDYIIPQTIIEDSSDWEEVKEKEYTILSFISPNGVIRNLTDNEEYVREDGKCPFSLEKMLELDKIHSVRRESDGEVFTLGDMVYLPSNSECAKKIQSIEIREYFISKMAVVVEDIIEWGLIHLQKAPIRKPILITEDGKEIFEGDKYYSVIDFGLPSVEEAKYGWALPKFHKIFSTEKAAEEYIKWNKPMYSLREVEEARCAMCGSTTVVGNLLALKSWKEK